MNIVIFGPPGAGKGTQSNLIVKKYNLYQLSTGELLRKEIKKNTTLGHKISEIINSGNLVSDNIVGSLIETYISNDKYKNKLIFDGYPRNLIQAEYLEKAINTLPDGYRVVFTMIEIEGYAHKEVAEMLGISVGTSKSQLFYAKKKLREILKNLV